jgi:hypothetical protein
VLFVVEEEEGCVGGGGGADEDEIVLLLAVFVVGEVAAGEEGVAEEVLVNDLGFDLIGGGEAAGVVLGADDFLGGGWGGWLGSAAGKEDG